MRDLLRRTALAPDGIARIVDGADVPLELDCARYRSPLIDASAHEALMRVPGVARYLLDSVEPALIAAESSAGEADLACFLHGPVRALDLLLRGLFTLRATAVRVGDAAVLICGQAAVGKSTLGAALALRGHAVLGENVVPVTADANGVSVWPSGGGVELWPPSAAQLRVGDHPSRPVRPVLAKRRYELGSAGSGTDRLALGLLVVLSLDRRLDTLAIRQVGVGRTAVQAVTAWQWHRRMIDALGLELANFDWLTNVAGAAPLIRLARPADGFTAGALAQAVESAVR